MLVPDAADRPSASAPVVTSTDLGRELKSWLRHGPNRRIKVAALAKRLEVSQSTLYAYLAGTTLPPSHVLDDLLCALGLPAQEHRRLVTARDALQRRRAATEPTASAAQTSRQHPVPRELPADPGPLTGRSAEIVALDRVLSNGTGLSVISGPAGVGKTALAVHWGHRVAEEFSDGCLYADLLGYAPYDPRDPTEVLAGFLRGLGLADADIPADSDERAARFRSALAGRRVLVVIDNARDAAQVRPLLPGSRSCFVLVTSRSDLPALQMRPGAHPISLAPLVRRDGVDLLRLHLIGRQAPAQDAVVALAERCAGLPLALRIVAALASTRRQRSLTELVEELTGGLHQLDVGEPDGSVRAVFSWSERSLEPQTGEAFRLLGLHPARDIDSFAAAALIGVDVEAAAQALDELAHAYLLARSTESRFGMHDLLREYAGEQAEATLAESARRTAITRLLDYYVTAGAKAMEVLHPPGAKIEPDWLVDVAVPPLRTSAEAKSWMDAEWQNLLAAVAFSARRGWPQHTLRLAAVLRRRLVDSHGHGDAMAIHGHALDASRLIGDRRAEGTALHHMGMAHTRLGRLREAQELLRHAIVICREAGDRYDEAGALNHLGILYERLGRYADAVECYSAALPLARELAFRHGEAALRTNIGFARGRLGEHEQAMRDCLAALAIHEELGDPGSIAAALGNLGEVYRLTGRHAEAFDHYDRALTKAREVDAVGVETEVLRYIGETHFAAGDGASARAAYDAALTAARITGDRYEEAHALDGLGRAHHAEGNTAQADSSWREALALFRELGLPDAQRVGALISS
ncbi:tetratricopeptide repeat protein [Allokutzneria sp. A3M-2-11 16]|uniref:tetratricopeptide repeat protein n=1 Tax=Allokutzneria sp. A3M-2-11 16 TaxID=2962043 RepID=UPI0020B71FD4|nr:tetratricopeptide repeat protein [Allokutzneria sp. A3M-2-11 16]MCP3803065.1 tetratricopeptide repeat protein [Allokutzneria sp. A3M-2-11 16]